MKRLLIASTVAVTAICLVAGCAGGVKTHTDSGQAISVNINQEFVISLDSNPTTGYRWQEGHDETMLELVKSEYEAGKEAKQGLVGAGGIEHFRFKALKAGETKITMSYKRPREKELLEKRVFTINIK